MIPNGPGQKNNYVEFIGLLKDLVAEGKVPQSRIDDAVRRILRVKFMTRLFEQPFTDPSLTAAIGSAEHRQVARDCVRQSLVLLKNENHVLPLGEKSQAPGRGRQGRRRPGHAVRRMDHQVAGPNRQSDQRRHYYPCRHPTNGGAWD